MNRNCGLIQHGTETAAFGQDVGEVGGEAIGDVDHGVQRCSFVDCQGLGDPRLGAEVAAGVQASAERTGDENHVARHCAAAAHGAAGGHLTDQSDADHALTVPRIGITADQVDVKSFGQ